MLHRAQEISHLIVGGRFRYHHHPMCGLKIRGADFSVHLSRKKMCIYSSLVWNPPGCKSCQCYHRCRVQYCSCFFIFDELQGPLNLQCPFSLFPGGGHMWNVYSRADVDCNGVALRPYMYSFEVRRGVYSMWILKLPWKRSSCCDSLAYLSDKTPDARFLLPAYNVYRIG
jgi:hypothetical protein